MSSKEFLLVDDEGDTLGIWKRKEGFRIRVQSYNGYVGAVDLTASQLHSLYAKIESLLEVGHDF